MEGKAVIQVILWLSPFLMNPCSCDHSALLLSIQQITKELKSKEEEKKTE